MKVLWFSNSMANADEYFNNQLKGTGGWLKSLDAELQNNVDLHIVYHSGTDKQKFFRYKKTTYYPIQIYKNKFAKNYAIFNNRILNEEFKEEYLRIINEVKPDIIHIHGTENPFGCIIGGTNIPVVTSIQGNLTVYSHKYYSGIGEKYLDVGIKKKIVFKNCFRNGYNQQLKMASIEQKNLLKCENIIGRTDWDYRITRILSPESKYYHVDEILRNEFHQVKWQKKENSKFVIYTTNSNSFYKGFETICKAVSLLHQIGVNFKWCIAGIKENDLIVRIVRKKLGNDFPRQSLKLLGNISANDIVENMLEANLYVMPSHIENSPNNLCEAMILGMPCITTLAGGVGSLLKDKEEGLIIQDGDPWAMAGAVMEIMNNEKQAIEYGKKARERSLKRHNKTKIVDDLLHIYKCIINNENN